MTTTGPRDAASAGQLRILVADDHDILRRAVQSLLRKLGHSVETVANGREAIEAATRERFDVLFLDIEMPLMGGVEAAYWVRRFYCGRQPIIIAISGEAQDGWLQKKGLMDDFLLKPLALSDLARALEVTTTKRGNVNGDTPSKVTTERAASPNAVTPLELSSESA